MDNNRYYMDGPGETLIIAEGFDFKAATPNLDKIIAVVTSKSTSIGGGITEEKVTGGRSIFPKRKFLTERETTFEMEDCEMDFRYNSLTQGEDIVEGSVDTWAFGEDFKFEVAATVVLAATPIANTLILTSEDGELFIAATTPAKGKYKADGPTLTFHEDDKDTVIYPVFQYKSKLTAKSASTKLDSLPKTVKIIHRMPAFDADNNLLGYEETEIFKAQTSGQFEKAYQEKTPYAPKLTFEVLDPRRADKKIVDTRFIPA